MLFHLTPRDILNMNTNLKRDHCDYVLTQQMDAFQRNRTTTSITLDVRISCDIFWNYKFNIPIRINDYYNANDRNINRNDGHMGRRDPGFCRLEEYLANYIIQHIYDDLVATRRHMDVPILLKKARKFHIHGRTLEDILFPSDTHATPENIVYICTHCE